MPSSTKTTTAPRLEGFGADLSQSSISGLSSGAFMTVQMHLAHSSRFVGAGIIAGGPFRCAESFRAAAMIAEDAFTLNALYTCMNPLIPQTGPNPDKLVQVARETADAGLIDDLKHLSKNRIYIFTGSEDKVVQSDVVNTTREFYKRLGVPVKNIRYVDDIPAGHSIITDNPEDSALSLNQPPYINNGGFMQSWDILSHIYGDLEDPSEQLSGSIVRFDQSEFFDPDNRQQDRERASMSDFAYAYIPKAVAEGAKCRVHIALHGCKQGYNYINYVNGKPDYQNSPPYGNRYFTTTGYNQIADSNNLIILYPQAQGADGNGVQNPDGCWDWWGYTSEDPQNPDYYSQNAIQIKAINRMLERLGEKRATKPAA
ncbi:extracellular catalytic domain type 2 short-chain-length polyhydroxyalkanoate depolymerase [Marinobacterium sp. YM272]|uniref:extracellular catalytic domain type 2 short-chain-length polyhydroxyalkanoate depolymerase n=1 Tax=Marinobacterium sp. YM272 TaxID=3421654 RepID=UPI003D7F40C3